MLLRSRLFWRVFLSCFLPAGAAAVCSGLLAANRLHAARYESIRRTFYEESRLVYELIQDDLKAERAAALQQKVRELTAALGCRITVLDKDGRVAADTEADTATMENHRLRPEIVEAADKGEGSSTRWSHTLQQELLYLAYRAPGASYFVRLAVPVEQVEKGLHFFDEGLLIGVAIIILLSAAVCFFLARWQARPILELTNVAQDLAAGNVNRRSLLRAHDEAGALGGALGTVAQTLAQTKAAAAKAQDDLQGILSSMTEAVIATDEQRRIVLANQTAASLLDFAAGSAAGKPLWEVVREDQILKAAELVATSGQNQTFRCGPIRGRFVGVTISPLPHTQAPPGLLLVAHDTTETVLYQELRKEFVANVSHELRTPLTFIKGFVETLQDGALKDPLKGPEYLATIEKHVNQLTNLVNDLLEISHLESRSGGMRQQHIKLADLLAKAADTMKPAAEKKKQSLNVSLPAGLPAITGDPDYLERAVANLLDNAVKYTPEEGTISVSAKADAAAVTVEVSDNGIGIPAQDLPRIFERFYRVDKSRSRDMGGTGLGLAIVKHIVHSHGGTVEVSSQPGKGSTFRIVLPRSPLTNGH